MKVYRNHLKTLLTCVGLCGVCGLFTGATIFFFRWMASQAERIAHAVYDGARGSLPLTAALLVGLAVLGLLMALLHRLIPEVRGGGIPRSEGVLRGLLPLRWFRTLIGTVFGSAISFFSGLPLGSEGPAVLIGTSLGGMCGKALKNQNAYGRYVMSGGAGAGFAVVTGAPIAGILFVLEEVHRRFSPLLALGASVSVLCATYVNRLLCQCFHLEFALFTIPKTSYLSLSHAGYLLLFALLLVVGVAIFDSSLLFFEKFSRKFTKRIPAPLRLMAVFVLVGAVGLFFPAGIHSGHHTVEDAVAGGTAGMLAITWAVRLLLLLLVADSGATGGMFVPTLAIGAVWAALCADLLLLLGLPGDVYATVVLLGMCAFLGGTLRAPVTAAVLFVELTGLDANLFSAVLLVFAVQLGTELIHQTSFYDRALHTMVASHREGKRFTTSRFQFTVKEGAFAVGKSIRDIFWPALTTVVSVSRNQANGQPVSSDGEQTLLAGDVLVVQATYSDEEELAQLLRGIAGRGCFIEKLP